MAPDLSRRDALRYGVATVPLLAGCSQRDEDDGTPGPDAGTDSYGIRVENRAHVEQKSQVDPVNLTYTVDLQLEYSFSDEPPLWKESVTLDPNESKEWTSVITEGREQVLLAELPNRHSGAPGTDEVSANHWITPDSDSAPDVEYLVVVVEYAYVDNGWVEEESRRDHNVYITHEGLDNDPGPWESLG